MDSTQIQTTLLESGISVEEDLFLSGYTGWFWKRNACLCDCAIIDVVNPSRETITNWNFLEAEQDFEVYTNPSFSFLIRSFSSIDKYQDYLLLRPFNTMAYSFSLRLGKDFNGEIHESSQFEFQNRNWNYYDFSDFSQYCLDRKVLPGRRLGNSSLKHLSKVSADWFFRFFEQKLMNGENHFTFLLSAYVNLGLLDSELEEWLEPSIVSLEFLERYYSQIEACLNDSDDSLIFLRRSFPWSHWTSLFLLSCDCSQIEMELDEMELLARLKSMHNWLDEEFQGVKPDKIKLRTWIEKFGEYSFAAFNYAALLYSIRFESSEGGARQVLQRSGDLIKVIEAEYEALKRLLDRVSLWKSSKENTALLHSALIKRLNGELLTIGQCKKWLESELG